MMMLIELSHINVYINDVRGESESLYKLKLDCLKNRKPTRDSNSRFRPSRRLALPGELIFSVSEVSRFESRYWTR